MKDTDDKKLTISSHALLRYIQRVYDFNIEKIKNDFIDEKKKEPNERQLLRYIQKEYDINIKELKADLLDRVNKLFNVITCDGRFPIKNSIIAVIKNKIIVTIIDTSKKED